MGRPSQRPPDPQPNTKAAVAAPTLAARAGLVMSRLRAAVDGLARSLNGNPALLTRLFVFIVGLLLMLGHRGIRQRVQRILAVSWGKLKATAGMGTKVSHV